MNVVLGLDDIKIHHIHFQESVKNTIIEGSDFIRIIYSNELFSLNGIYIDFELDTTHIEKYFNKYKYVLNNMTERNKSIISRLSQLEKDILDKVNIPGKKTPIYKISEHLHNGNIKLFIENNIPQAGINKYILKISGIWANETEYGITFKFGE
jgi:hypothetical protein